MGPVRGVRVPLVSQRVLTRRRASDVTVRFPGLFGFATGPSADSAPVQPSPAKRVLGLP